jgi:hypothetical protein
MAGCQRKEKILLTFFNVLTVFLIIQLFWLPSETKAGAVGQIVQVEGRVDILKGGKLPSIPAQKHGEVEEGDVIRTKTLSRIEIRFVDDTILTIAPESRVAIEEYLFIAAKEQRQTKLRVFLGLVKTKVSKLFKGAVPDFTIISKAAIIGVRGTTWYTLIRPNATDIFNETGEIEVSNFHPEIKGKVVLHKMEFTRVAAQATPTLPLPITPDDLRRLNQQLLFGTSEQKSSLELDSLAPSSAAGNVPSHTYYKYLYSGNSMQKMVENLNSGLYVYPNISTPANHPGSVSVKPSSISSPSSPSPNNPSQEIIRPRAPF